MANAFQKQLLKAGLVSKDKLNKVNKSRHKAARQQPKDQMTDEEQRKEQIKQAALLKAEHDRELNRQRVEAANKKAISAQIKQLIEMNLLTDYAGDVSFNFEDNKIIKHLYVTEDIRKQIINGRLAIVRQADKYVLVARRVAEKIMQRDTDVIVLCNDKDQTTIDDDYADFKVPDDLMW